MRSEYRTYPPQMAGDVEIIQQPDGNRPAFIVGCASAGRFILLGETECRVLKLLDGSHTPAEVCEEFTRLNDAKLTQRTLIKFLTKLDQAGILAGERVNSVVPADLMPGPQFYLRWKLFNPDRLFERMIPILRWIWTPGFVAFSIFLAAVALLFALMNWAELESCVLYAMHEHYVAILIAGTLVGFSHEFAHGLTCKAFGGRVPEVGVLMIYYLLPALYCNVSGAYLIPERNRRLWVIAAGVYWQVLVGVVALLAWFTVEPHTLISDLAIFFFLGSIVDVVFNANPLIKLDGYYFLSQLLRMPNLMDRSRSFWRGLLKGMLVCKSDESTRQWNKRERAIYAAFGLTSFVYTVVLRTVIVCYVGSYLADKLHTTGLLLAGGLGVFYMRQPLGQVISGTRKSASRICETILRVMREAVMKNGDEKNADETKPEAAKTKQWRRRIVLSTVVLVISAIPFVPWNASVGSYGTLVSISGQEAIIRAPENATLIELRAQPGALISSHSVVGRMGNLELEEQIVQAQSELARSSADYDRLSGELRAREEATARAELQLSQRRHEFNEINSEQQQINDRRERRTTEVRMVSVAYSPSAEAPAYPAALAVLQSDVDMLGVQLQEANTKVERAQRLYNQGVLPRSEMDSAQTHAASLDLELSKARRRLEAALVEHRRKHTSTSTEMRQASSDVRAEQLESEVLTSQLRATSELIRVLQTRLDLLRRKQAQFELITPREGTVYGEELPRMVGRYFQKGEEICRVADTRRMLLRIPVPEREIGDLRVGLSVRLKTRAFSDRIFYGIVSKIGSESERDEFNQTTYRVEIAIENSEGLLRPGMTAFARVDFGRQMLGQIVVRKVKQMLRPEMWMF
jgi:putative peptide zinc metalloprotease protein